MENRSKKHAICIWNKKRSHTRNEHLRSFLQDNPKHHIYTTCVLAHQQLVSCIIIYIFVYLQDFNQIFLKNKYIYDKTAPTFRVWCVYF